MEDNAECMLVLIGATPEGKKELVSFQVGARESEQSWRELLLDVKARVGDRPGDGDRRRGARVLEGIAEVFRTLAPALLGAQDGERVQQAAQAVQPEDEEGPAPDLDGADEAFGGEVVRSVRRDVQAEVRVGGGVPGQGPRGVAGVL